MNEKEVLRAIQPDVAGTSYTDPGSIARASILAAVKMEQETRSYLEICQAYQYSRKNPCPSLSPRETHNETIWGAVDIDTFEGAKLLGGVGLGKVAVINMANEYNCGGGFERAWGSQEECLFRRSTLGFNLWPHRRVDDNRMDDLNSQLARKEPIYPLTECGGIYSPNVAVIRNIHMVPYRSSQYQVEERYMVSVLSVAAQDLRYWMSHVKEKEFNEELTIGKMRTLLWMAAHHGHKVIVLGALGCGAFQNQPACISNLFRDLLEKEFQGVFKVVLFAITKSDHNLNSFGSRFGKFTPADFLSKVEASVASL